MSHAFFPGCRIPHHLPQHGLAVRAVCRVLGLELVDAAFNCCGYPVRHRSFEAAVFSAARNLALAARLGLPILTPCKCCFGNLSQSRFWLRRNRPLRHAVADLLAREHPGATPKAIMEAALGTEVVHLLTALDRVVGAEALAALVQRPLAGLSVAAHYGCHALRPSRAVDFDNPLAPTVFERLVKATGADCVDWPLRLECCGHPLSGKNDVLAWRLAGRKLADAARAGADVVCTACTYCQLQFDVLRADNADRVPAGAPPAVLFPQLLGLSLGLAPEELGLGLNRLVPAPVLAAAGRRP